MQLGLERFHGVGILGFNSAEWFFSGVGAIMAGWERHIRLQQQPDLHYTKHRPESAYICTQIHSVVVIVLIPFISSDTCSYCNDTFTNLSCVYNDLYSSYRGIMTGIYATNSPEACQYVAVDSKANIIVVENQKQLDKILQVSLLKHIKVFTNIIQNTLWYISHSWYHRYVTLCPIWKP